MKKFLPLIALLFAIQFSSTAQVQRLVLVEEFTNASCPPCAAQNPGFNALMRQNDRKVVVMKYQVWFPGYDPMYEQNPTEVRNRATYYGVNSAPNVRLDGAMNAGTAGSVTQALVDLRAAAVTPIKLDLTHDVAADLSAMNIRLVIHNKGTTEFSATNMVAHIAIVENQINFPEPPGTTDEQDFDHVMRKMLPNETGTPFANNIPAGDSLVIEMTDVEIPGYFYNFEQIALVAFVQNTATKQVAQATLNNPKPLQMAFPDVAADANTDAPQGLCEYDLVPAVTITNQKDVTINSVVISYTINGGDPETIEWTGTLEKDQTAEITFPALTTTPYATNLEYVIESVNGGRDINALNHLIPGEVYYNLSENSIWESYDEGFDIAEVGDIPNGLLVIDPNEVAAFYTVNQNVSTAVTWNLGGFGNSDGCFRFDFWTIAAGEMPMLVFDKADLSETQNAKLALSSAYARYVDGTFLSNDGLRVVVSTDCAATWQTVWERLGANLQTVAPIGASRFYPRPAEWRRDTIDLSAYDQMDEVIVGIIGVSDFGNSCYIDDIELFGEPVSSVNEPTEISAINVFPNPAKENVAVEIELTEASDVSVNVYDVTGKLVSSLLQNEQLAPGTYRYNWNANVAEGVYLVRISTQKGETTKRVTVIK